MSGTVIMIIVGVVMLAVLGGISLYSQNYSLNIKDKTVGHGQHGTARWATKSEVVRTYRHISFTPQVWRNGKNLPKERCWL